MTYQFTWEPTPPVRTGAEMRRVAIFAAGIGSVFICSTLAQFGVSFIFSLFAPELLKQMWFRLLASTFCLYLFGMLPGWLILRNIKPEPIESRRLGAVSVVALLSVSVAFLLLGSFAGNFVNTVIESLTGKAQKNPVQNVADNTPLGVMALCTVILAPVAEELFFRKVVIDRLRKYGDIPAILLSATIFGLAHGNFSQFFYAFLLGLAFGAVYCMTGRLRYSIALHVGLNFFGSVWSTLLIRRVGSTFTIETLVGDPIALGMYLVDLAVYGFAVLTVIPSLVWLLKRFHPRRWKSPYTGGQWAKIVLLNPAVWLACAVFVAMFWMAIG